MFRRALVPIALATLVACVVMLATAAPVFADGPDYALPGEFRLPWAAGEIYRVTWEPADHWANAKARGVAYDFSMDIGTPLYAPTDGWIYYLYDERPFSTNYGHYVEIVSDDGDWLIRLAHLRDPQSGEGPISAGEPIGHSGMSGADAAHLHLELLVREGSAWVCPDLARFERLYGYPVAAILEDALLASHEMVSGGNVSASMAIESHAAFGQPVSATLGLANDGVSAVTIETLQMTWLHDSGDSVLVELSGPLQVLAQSNLTLTLPASLPRSGIWTCSGVTYQGDGVADKLDVDGRVNVAASPLSVADLELRKGVGHTLEPLDLRLQLANTGRVPITCDGTELIGRRPDGSPWHLLLDEPLRIGAHASHWVDMIAKLPAGQAGEWIVHDVTCLVDGKRHYLRTETMTFEILGPELRVESLQMFDGTRSLHMMLTLRNVGTEPIRPDQVEAWGWQPDGVSSFGANQPVRMPIQPGASARFLLTVPTDGDVGTWRVTEAGFWRDGDYVALPLPSEPAIKVAPLALISLLK